MSRTAPKFSFVVPIYNEEESIGELLASIDEAVRPMSGAHEVVFVDDGSTDGTLETLKRLSRTRPEMRIFSFRRNLGKALALACGFQMAGGEYIMTIDADLQDDPRNLQPMHEHLASEGADVVSGWRKNRRDKPVKILSSKIFSLVVRALFGASFHDMNSGCKLYRADVARDLRLYGGMHRFIPLIARELGYRILEIPIVHHQRKHGVSKYRSTKVLTEIPDLLTVFFLMKYTRRPLHFFGRIGSALFLVGFVVLLYLSYLWTQGIPIGTRPLLSFGVLLALIGGQTVFTGLLADLIVNVNYNQNRMQEFPLKYASDREAAL